MIDLYAHGRRPVRLFRRTASILYASLLLSEVAGVAIAQTPAEFFKGKSVNLLIGFGVGGDDDLWGRVIARNMGSHIPGQPTVVPQNVPGAAGLLVANRLYNVAPKDGTVIGIINSGIPFEPLLGGQGVQFDPLKLNWIGSPNRDTTVCAARKDGTGWVLNGHKAVVIGAPWASHLIVTARTGGSQSEAGGVSVFLVEKSAAGVVTRDYPNVEGQRASGGYDVVREDVVFQGDGDAVERAPDAALGTLAVALVGFLIYVGIYGDDAVELVFVHADAGEVEGDELVGGQLAGFEGGAEIGDGGFGDVEGWVFVLGGQG